LPWGNGFMVIFRAVFDFFELFPTASAETGEPGQISETKKVHALKGPQLVICVLS
jgi:hypothetical protein